MLDKLGTGVFFSPRHISHFVGQEHTIMLHLMFHSVTNNCSLLRAMFQETNLKVYDSIEEAMHAFIFFM